MAMLSFRKFLAVGTGLVLFCSYGTRIVAQPANGEEVAQESGNFSVDESDFLPTDSPFTAPAQEREDYVDPGLLLNNSSEPQVILSPEDLDPSTNPLLFPTEANEVEVGNTKPITLEQAIELGLRNNRDIREARLTLERSGESLREALAAEYPNISAEANFTRSDSANTELSQARSDFFTLFSGDDDTVTTSFETRLEVTYDLYTSGRRSAQIKAAEEQLRFNQLELERTAEQTRLDITVAYYDLQEADDRVRISRAAVEEAAASLRNTQLREEAGLGTRFDVLRDQVQLANAQQDLQLAFSQQEIARRALVQLLGLGQKVAVVAADPVGKAGTWDLSLEETIVLAIRNRAELEQQIAQMNISEQQKTIALSNLRPQASLFANYNILGVLDDNLDPADGFTLGARLRWNLFDGGASRARAEQEEKNIAIAENRFDNQRNRIRLEVEQAYYNLLANEENITTAETSVEFAQESLRLARLRLQAGVGIKSDEIEAQTELTRAKNNRLQAILDYNRALSSLQRAVSNLPDGRLFDTP